MMLDTDWANITACENCPRACGVNRSEGRLGYCRLGEEEAVASVCTHRGEEPVISGSNGICNIFFGHCNLQCRYCQNHQISDNKQPPPNQRLTAVVAQIENILQEGVKGVGFVSPSHCLPTMARIMHTLNSHGHKPIYVYNSNGYDKVDNLRALADNIDVYLPDLKYLDDRLAQEFSDVENYTATAREALKEMYRQKGADLVLDDDGLAVSGLIIRHLVLPGNIENSKAVLRFIARELSPDIHISLMSQYHPTEAVKDHPDLSRVLRVEEYDEVLDEFDRLGLHQGWQQQLESSDHYKPDFDKEHPFEN
jgi:putative pyruvate formate lyase activating enzyme